MRVLYVVQRVVRSCVTSVTCPFRKGVLHYRYIQIITRIINSTVVTLYPVGIVFVLPTYLLGDVITYTHMSFSGKTYGLYLIGFKCVVYVWRWHFFFENEHTVGNIFHNIK